MRLAGYIQQGIEKAVGNKSPNRGAKSAFFYVLKAVKMPSVLIEIGFVTNPEESDNLLDSGYQKKVAMGIADGVSDFIKHFSETEGFTK
jgi:N-acetylmuramoyl-L-alanine amidase